MTRYFQNDDRDEDAHQAYKSLFFFMYYNQDNPDEYEWFKKDLKKRSAEDFNFFYTEEEEVFIFCGPSFSQFFP